MPRETHAQLLGAWAAILLALLLHGGLFVALGCILARETRRPEAFVISLGIEFSELETAPQEVEEFVSVPVEGERPRSPDPEPVVEPPPPEPILTQPEPAPALPDVEAVEEVEEVEAIEPEEFTEPVEPADAVEDIHDVEDVDVVENVEAIAPPPEAAPLDSTPPRAKNEIRPVYPMDARRRGDEGVVTYEFFISEKGVVTDAVLVQSSGFPELDRAARKAIMAARFTPATRDGKPVAFWLQQAIEFKIQN